MEIELTKGKFSLTYFARVMKLQWFQQSWGKGFQTVNWNHSHGLLEWRSDSSHGTKLLKA